MIKQYFKKEDIDKIVAILKKYTKLDFQPTDHYKLRITQRDIKHSFLTKTFFEFEKIKLIKEDLLKGDIGYDLHYELSKNRTLIIGVIPKKKLILTHGILRYRKWQSSLKAKSRR